MIMCSSRKNGYPLHGRLLEIPRGRGVLKVKILEEKYEAKLVFPAGRGSVNQKNIPWGEYGYFLELHNACNMEQTNHLANCNNTLLLHVHIPIIPLQNKCQQSYTSFEHCYYLIFHILYSFSINYLLHNK